MTLNFTMKRYLILFIILLLYLFVASYNLDKLPGEWFGDISNLHEYVLDIQHGKWPISYRQGVGPLYHYAIIPFLPLTEQRYIGYKNLSVISGALSLFAIFMFVWELIDLPAALVTIGITAVSCWFLVWARLGNLHAILPGVVALSLWCALRFAKTNKLTYLILGSIIASCGLFLYMGVVLLPVAFTVLILLHLKNKRLPVVSLLAVIMSIASLLFVCVVLADTHEFFDPHGYIGEKMVSITRLSLPTLLERTISYSIQTAGMLHWKGDHIFRVNVPDSPMLDPVSGIFFLIGGIVFFTKYKEKKYFLLIPAIFLVLPAIFPSLHPDQIPSATRTFAVTPFIFLLVALGILALRKFGKLGNIGMLGVLIVIGLLNLHKYFIEYPQTLPNHNVAYGALIAYYIDSIPNTIPVYVTDCCWGEWGQPDPKGIYYQLHDLRNRENILQHNADVTCDDVGKKQSIILLSPRQQDLALKLAACSPSGSLQTHSYVGQFVFITVKY